MGQAAADPAVNHTSLFIVNGAHGGKSAAYWDSPDRPRLRPHRHRLAHAEWPERTAGAGRLGESRQSGPTISLPNANSDAYRLVDQMGDIARALKVRYPNLQQVFFSSRIYAGYATHDAQPRAVRIRVGPGREMADRGADQSDEWRRRSIRGPATSITQAGVAPWLAWGPYLWADGLNPRSDGLIWQQQDFQSDGTHPSQSGEEKVGAMLLDFMSSSPFTEPWFLRPVPGDYNQRRHRRRRRLRRLAQERRNTRPVSTCGGHTSAKRPAAARVPVRMPPSPNRQRW